MVLQRAFRVSCAGTLLDSVRTLVSRPAVAVAVLALVSLTTSCDAFVPGATSLRLPRVSPSISLRNGGPSVALAAQRFYDRAGGAGAIDTCVEDFYDRLEDDEDLQEALALKKTGKIDMDYLKLNQWNMMRFAFKGKPTNGVLRLADLATGLSAQHWDTLLGHMGDTFEFLALEDDIVEEAMSNVKLLEEKFKRSKTKPSAAFIAAMEADKEGK
mmetsp:Transcript_24445/g.47532  ORF Transcript_24445/g.47532 Transcript_24445/m.47532 type:complete len:214 (+) Transcript_24445:37-678(+)